MQNRAASHWQWGVFKTLQGPKISAVSFSPVLCLPVVFDLWRLTLPRLGPVNKYEGLQPQRLPPPNPPAPWRLGHCEGQCFSREAAQVILCLISNGTILKSKFVFGFYPRIFSAASATNIRYYYDFLSSVLCPHLFFDCQLSSAVHPRIPGRSVLCGGVFLSFGCCGGSGGGWEIWTRMAQMPQTILGGGALEMTIFLQELRLGELIDDILRGSTLTQTRWYLVL